jgi:hypothetical protein
MTLSLSLAMQTAILRGRYDGVLEWIASGCATPQQTREALHLIHQSKRKIRS